MTDNNWITEMWIEKKRELYVKHNDEYDGFYPFLAAEINKEIKNILEAAAKRECKDCKHEPPDPHQKACIYCHEFVANRNWTPKEGK